MLINPVVIYNADPISINNQISAHFITVINTGKISLYFLIRVKRKCKSSFILLNSNRILKLLGE